MPGANKPKGVIERTREHQHRALDLGLWGIGAEVPGNWLSALLSGNEGLLSRPQVRDPQLKAWCHGQHRHEATATPHGCSPRPLPLLSVVACGPHPTPTAFMLSSCCSTSLLFKNNNNKVLFI